MTSINPQRAQLERKAEHYAREVPQAATSDVKFSLFTSYMIVRTQLECLDKFARQPKGGQQRLPDEALSWLIKRWAIHPGVHQQFLREGISLVRLIEIADKALEAQRKDSPALQQLKISFDSQNLGAKWTRL